MATLTHLTYEEALALPDPKQIWLDRSRCIVDTSPLVISPEANIANVTNFGADRNGVQDSSKGIKEAISYLKFIGGGILYFPQGVHRITSTIIVDAPGITLLGEGWKTIITRSGDFGDTLLLSGDDTTGKVLSDSRISNLTFKSTGLTTFGAHVHLNGVDHLYMDKVYFNQGFIGIQADALTAAYLSKIYMVFTNLFGGSIVGRRYMQFGSAPTTYGHPSSGDVFIDNYNLRGNIANQVTEHGICINSADGIWFDNGHVGNTTGANVYFNRTSPEILNLVYFDNFMSDASAGMGVYFDGSNPSVDIKFSNFTIKGGGLSTIGVSCSDTCVANYVQFNNGSISEFKYEGVKIPDGASSFRMSEFNNVQVHGNATDISISSSGYYLGDATTDLTISGGCSGRNGLNGGAGLQQHGIKFGPLLAPVNVRINDVDLTGNATTASISGGSAAIVTNCQLSSVGIPIPSADKLFLRPGEEYFYVSGVTTITTIASTYKGRKVELIFQNTLTVVNGGNLKLAGDFISSPNSVLVLRYDGTNWIELSRNIK